MAREKLDPFWHRSRVAARIWLKAQQGKPLSPRDKRVARVLVADKGVTDRLMEQARTFWTAAYTFADGLSYKPNPCRVVVPNLELGDTRR